MKHGIEIDPTIWPPPKSTQQRQEDTQAIKLAVWVSVGGVLMVVALVSMTLL